MCETKVILKDGDDEKEIMAEAALIDVKDGGVVIFDILGNSQTIGDCELEKIDFMKHEAILKKSVHGSG